MLTSISFVSYHKEIWDRGGQKYPPPLPPFTSQENRGEIKRDDLKRKLEMKSVTAISDQQELDEVIVVGSSPRRRSCHSKCQHAIRAVKRMKI